MVRLSKFANVMLTTSVKNNVAEIVSSHGSHSLSVSHIVIDLQVSERNAINSLTSLKGINSNKLLIRNLSK